MARVLVDVVDELARRERSRLVHQLAQVDLLTPATGCPLTAGVTRSDIAGQCVAVDEAALRRGGSYALVARRWATSTVSPESSPPFDRS